MFKLIAAKKDSQVWFKFTFLFLWYFLIEICGNRSSVNYSFLPYWTNFEIVGGFLILTKGHEYKALKKDLT